MNDMPVTQNTAIRLPWFTSHQCGDMLAMDASQWIRTARLLLQVLTANDYRNSTYAAANDELYRLECEMPCNQ